MTVTPFREIGPASFRGHVFHFAAVPDIPELGLDPAGRCVHCGLTLTMSDVENGWAPKPCPETDEGRALIAQAEAAAEKDQAQVTEPCVAVPPDWEGTDAEAVALAVAGAFQAISQERDDLEDQLTEARCLLIALADAFPQTSFAASNVALDNAKAYLDRTTVPAADK